jgi:hypothetical protein
LDLVNGETLSWVFWKWCSWNNISKEELAKKYKALISAAIIK